MQRRRRRPKQEVEIARSIYAKQSISFVANVVGNGVHQVCSLRAKLKIHSFSFSHCTPAALCHSLASGFAIFAWLRNLVVYSVFCLHAFCFFFFSSSLQLLCPPQRNAPVEAAGRVCLDRMKCAIKSKLSTRKCHNRHRQNTLFSLFAILFVTRSLFEPSTIGCSWSMDDEPTKITRTKTCFIKFERRKVLWMNQRDH